MSGFCDASLYKKINSTDIDEVEKFVREDLSEYFKTGAVKLVYGSELDDAFGKLYAKKPNQFKFLPGDRKFISVIVEYANSMSGNKKLSLADEIKKHPENSGKTDQSKISEYAQRTVYFLDKLQTVAKQNLKLKKGAFRYDTEIKMIASFLRMVCGPYAYEIIQRNLEGALPSIVSTNRYIKSSQCIVVEGVLRCKELVEFLQERNLPLVVCLSEDATRITGRIQYDSKTNEIMGFTLPIDKATGMPTPSAYPARNAQEILNHFTNGNSISSYVVAIMAQPLAHVPPFCLDIFSSDCVYSSTDIENRWLYITGELAKMNVKVLIISTDSDPKYNRAMRKLSRLTIDSVYSKWSSNSLKPISCPFFVQDSIHIGTKLRNFLLKFYSVKRLTFGPKYFIGVEHLHMLLNTVTKDQHLLTASTLNPSDRQNFQSVLRMCSEKVTVLLFIFLK